MTIVAPGGMRGSAASEQGDRVNVPSRSFGTNDGPISSDPSRMYFFHVAFLGVGLTVFTLAWGTLALLIAALLAAATSSFFRSVGDFDNQVREATMDLAPAQRRRFYDLYTSLRPKNPAVAWFLAVGLGPAGANLYREKWPAMLGALVTFNGLGAWWIESWFTTPYLVLIENRASIAYALELLGREGLSPKVETPLPELRPVSNAIPFAPSRLPIEARSGTRR